MQEPDLFDALRAAGIEADDHEIRAAVRLVTTHAEEVGQRLGTQRARRCMEAMQAALAYQLRHPDVEDMSTFEAAYDEDE